METNHNADAVFREVQARFKKGMATLPGVVGNEVVNFSKESFTKQGWTDGGFRPWKKRKKRGKKDNGRAILVKSGRLKRSPRIMRTTADMVAVGSDVPYAKIHNEGSNEVVTVRSHKRNIYSSRKEGTGKYIKSGKERVQTIKGISGSTMVKEHKRQMRMPRRKFLGYSVEMVARLKRVAAVHLIKYTR